MALARLGQYSHKGRELYQDALLESAFRMQRPVDSITYNKDTWLFLRSSRSCGVCLSSNLAELIGGGGLQLM